jgi:hypothetical protein
VRTLLSRVVAAFAIMVVPVTAAAAPIGPDTIIAIPHYPNETCFNIRADGRYQIQTCWTRDPITSIEKWMNAALPDEDGWSENGTARERSRNGVRQSVDIGELRTIKYYAFDLTG